MTERKLRSVGPRIEALVAQDRDLLKALVKEALDQILQAEMTEFLGAVPVKAAGSRAGLPGGLLRARLGDAGGEDRTAGAADRSGSSRRRCSSAFSAARRRWCRRWWRCTCKGCRRAR